MIHLYSAPISTPLFVNCLYNLEVLANLHTATAFDIFTRYDFLTLTGEVLFLILFYIHPRISLLFGSKNFFQCKIGFLCYTNAKFLVGDDRIVAAQRFSEV